MNTPAAIPAAPVPAATSAEENLVDYYLTQLARLSADARLEVIARLSQTLKSAAPTAKKSILDFAGAWADMPGTDEEIIARIRDARTFTRPEITLY